ncbi:MAG: hypothetical protein COA45_01440 [Zetaproteobacteria bacterium]|nr:MAG: hypothetical protein COA45_01440 [Zetaproteobacteria bacterium]
MIGLVVVGFDILPEAILVALQCMTGKQKQICAVSISIDEDVKAQRQAILEAISSVDEGAGVLVFTDSAAAPAGLIMMSIIDKENIQVLHGVNLTMLCKVVEQREYLELEDLAKLARDEGRKGISWLSP